MKKPLTFALLFFFSQFVMAQKAIGVLLKNGERLQVNTLEKLTQGFLIHKKGASDSLLLSEHEIQGIYYDGRFPARSYPGQAQQGTFRQKSGFYNQTELQWQRARGRQDELRSDISIHTVNGWAIRSYLMPGLGFGIDHFRSYTFTPLYLHLKGLLLDRRLTPYYYGSLGWGFLWNPEERFPQFDYEWARGGLMWQAGLGLQVNLRESALTLGVGFRQQQALLDYRYTGFDLTRSSVPIQNIEVEEERLIRRLSISFGFTF